MSIDPKKFGLSASLVNAVNEALKGGQVKLDKNHNGKLDSDDFKKLRGEQSPADYDKNNFKHGMLGTDKKMKNEVADGNKANFKANMKEDETKLVAKPQYDKTRPAFTEPKKKVTVKPQYDKMRPAFKEEVEQVNETVETTHENPLVTVHDKDGLHTHANLSTANKIFNTNVKHTDVHKGNVMVTSGHKDKNKLKFAISKHHATKVRKLTKEEVVDEAAVAGNNVVADMDARKTEVQRKIAQKQASFQQSKANKRISSPTMKEAKCTCGEGKGSKMTCEVCNSDKGLKGGKEPILINPPLKEGSNLMHQLRNQLASKTK